MKTRRVITGHSKEGKSVVASDEMVTDISLPISPEDKINVIWGADEIQTYPNDGTVPNHQGYFPPVGGVRFHVNSAAPAGAPGDQSLEALAETEQLMPGLLATFDPDDPGFHTTDTTDLIYIVSGRIVLKLDDGLEVELRAGDVLVQNGARHAWHNPGTEPCKIIGFIVGAHRSV